MKITVTDQSGKQFTIDMDPTDNIFQLKGKVARQAGGGNVHQMKIFFNGKELDNFSNFIQNQIKEGDRLNSQIQAPVNQSPAPVQQHRASDPFAAFGGGNMQQAPMQQVPVPQQQRLNFMSNPVFVQQVSQMRENIINNSTKLSSLLEKDPELAQAFLSEELEDSVQFLGMRVSISYSDTPGKHEEEARRRRTRR